MNVADADLAEVRSPSISVVICVYTEERSDQIRAAIDSVLAQTLPATETIVVVDHNPALYKHLVAAGTDVTVAENQEASGLSGGRNTGVALAQGEIIAFLDDDAVAHPDWLKCLVDAYANPEIQGVGGLALPNWQTVRPSWMPEEFYWVVGCNYRGMPPSGMPVRNLIGGNMSFRREVFAVIDGFQAGIGRSAAKRPFGGEETEFCIRLGQKSPGSILVMEHRALVFHFIPDSRCRFSYFISRCYAEGISKARVTANVGFSDGLSVENSYATRTLPIGVARGVADLFRGDPTGLARAGSIIAGLAITAAGYLRARLARVADPSQASS
jgi:glucosyl-dolichyl phosphate glucuronosyltransferase